MHKLMVATLAVAVLGGVVVSQDAKPPVANPVQKERQMGLAKPVEFTPEKEVYGAQLAGKGIVPLAAIYKEGKKFDGKAVQLRGTLSSVCAKKGCWVVLKEGEQEVRVRFANYKFFVPLDVAGRAAAIEGLLEVGVETEAQRRHYAKDAGKSPDEIAKIVGDLSSITLIADAIQIGKLPEVKKSCCEDAKEGCGEACGDACGEACEGEKKPATKPEPKPAPKPAGG